MKKIAYLLFVAFLVIGIYSCDKDDDSPVAATTIATTTSTYDANATISGVGSLPAGVSGDISNTRIALYMTVDDWIWDRTFKFTACAANGSYILVGVVPGVFYMDAWKDNDNDRFWGSSGDYVWVNGSGAFPAYTLAPIQFPGGQITTIDFVIFLVP